MRYVSYTSLHPWGCSGVPLTIAEQDEAIVAFAKEKGWNIVNRYSDSKKQEDDKSMQQLVHDGMERQYDGVVVAAFPCFGIDAEFACRFAFDFLYAAGIQFAVVEDGFDSSKMEEKEVVSYFEQKKRERLASRLNEWRDGCDNQVYRELMLHRWMAYGYELSEEGDSFVKDRNVAEHVEKIFQYYLAGAKTVEIARWLNEKGVLSRSAYMQKKAGKEPTYNVGWNSGSVADFLSNEIYAGKGYHKYNGRNVELSFEPYISEEEYRTIIERLETEKRKVQKAKGNRENPFVYRIFSEASGQGMVLGRDEDYYIEKKYRDCSEKLRIEHSISLETVKKKVREQLLTEKRRAENVARLISDGEGEAFLWEARGILSTRMRNVMEKMKPLLEESLQSLPLTELDAESDEISKELKKLKLAYSLKNPWIVLFQDAEIPDDIDRDTFRKLVERITVSGDYREVTVDFKYSDMKRYLPMEWIEEEGI